MPTARTSSSSSSITGYFVLSYLLFWVLLGVTGFLIFLKVPGPLVAAMKNVCAWAPTFALAILFRRLNPGTSWKDFLRAQVAEKPRAGLFLAVLAAQAGILVLARAVHSALGGQPFAAWTLPAPAALAAAFVVNLTSGPLGEELGWRGYALPRLRRTRSTTASGLLLGLVWGFWHLPLWLMSGFSGPDLLRYVLAFLAAIVSVSVLIAHALERNRNILLAVWIHFWFNFLVQLAGIDILALMTYIAVGYGFAAVLVVALAERRPAAP